MSIASRITAMQEHLQDDYDVLTLAGADLTNVDKNIVNLKPTWKERLLYFINNGTDEVWNNWDKVTGEGTSLTLNNTLEAKMKIDLKGNTYQEGTPTPESPQDIHVVSGDNTIKVSNKNLAPTNWASNFVNVVNNTTLAKLVVKDNRNCLFYKVNAGYPDYSNKNFTLGMKFKENTQYTISYDAFKESSNQKCVVIHYTDGTITPSPMFSNIETWEHQTITSTANKTIDYIFVGYYSGDTYIDIDTWQIEEGTNATSYVEHKEQTYPVNLPVENLLETKIATETKNGVTITHNEDGSYTLNGTATSGFAFESETYSQTFKAGTYILGSSATLPNGLFYSLLERNIYYFYTRFGIDTATHTFDEDTTISAFREYMWIANGTTFDNFVLKPQLEKGNKVNSYNKYGTTPIWLGWIGSYQDRFIRNSGKNLFDNSKAQIGKAWNNSSNTARAILITKVQPNTTYTISYLNKSAVDDIYWFDRVNEDDSTYITGNTPITQTTTITTKSNANYLGIQFNKTSITQEDINKVGIMLNEGTTALPYEPYGNGDWYLNKQIGKVVLDGSENWGTNASWNYTNTNNYYTNLGLSNDNLLSNHFTYEAGTYTLDTNGIMQRIWTTNLLVRIDKSLASDVSAFKTWLSTNNTSVYYVLATPTYTKIEGELANQLNALSGAKSYNSQTNISQENNDNSSIMSAVALSE